MTCDVISLRACSIQTRPDEKASTDGNEEAECCEGVGAERADLVYSCDGLTVLRISLGE